MISFCKLSKQINFVSKCFKIIPKVAGERNNFGPTFYAMDKFARHSEYIGKKHANNLESIRASVQRCVEKPEAKAFTEDIKTLLYLTKEDSDFQLLIKAIAKYHSQEASPIFNFRFGAPLMRLAHTLNKSNEMIELYLKEEPNFLHNTVTPGFILMNKLFDERRFDDVLKIFHRLKKAMESQATKDKDFFPYDALKVAIEANLEINDDESNKNAVTLFNIVKEIKPMANPSKMVTCLFLAAVQRGNNELANEIYSYLASRQKTSIVVTNLKIINMCLLNKTREALESFQLDNRSKNTNEKRSQTFYFKTTLDTLKKSVELSNNDEHKKMLDEVMSKIKSENLVAQSDIKEYATRQVNYTMAEKERLRNERERINSNERSPETDTFKSRNRYGNRPQNQSTDQNDRKQNRDQDQSADSGNEEFERSNDRRNNSQRTDQNRTQSNSPKNRRQYLE